MVLHGKLNLENTEEILSSEDLPEKLLFLAVHLHSRHKSIDMVHGLHPKFLFFCSWGSLKPPLIQVGNSWWTGNLVI
ncbi:hypothetical protein CEXT_115431 [Caerostris extrusa]|uniref:Uncharacterized protein n=1 Tax=Caerostris extrusa TaxID=172846 RepID=A0AAV4MSN1_CAEEX|nr:hypothetical protein CEXT_115431 [Caerostris extrusa]